MGLTEFEFESSKAPEVLLWGFLEFHHLDTIEAHVRCTSESDDVATIMIEHDNRSIEARMYRLPGAARAFGDDVAFFGESRKSWALPDGRPFDMNLLSPRGMPEAWNHKAIQTYSEGPGILHAWRGGDRALVIRYRMSQPAQLNDALFEWATKKIAALEKTWQVSEPKLTMPRGPTDDLDEWIETPLSAEELGHVEDAAMMAWSAMKISDNVKREEVIAAIYTEIERFRPKWPTLKPNIQHNFSVSAGALWGQMLCGAAGWEWTSLGTAIEEPVLTLVSPDRAYALRPVNVILKQFEEQDDGTPPQNTVRLLFNMIEAEKLPPSKPRAYLMLT